MASTIAGYLARFEALGTEIAYAERQGYRTSRFSYRDVARMAYGFAAELAAKGIHKGDRVVLWGPNSAAWVAAFLGCAYQGVIAVPMDDAASPEKARALYEFFVEQIRQAGLICETGRFQEMMQVELVNNGPVTILLDSAKGF